MTSKLMIAVGLLVFTASGCSGGSSAGGSPAIEIIPQSAQLPRNRVLQLVARSGRIDITSGVTWSSSNESVATVGRHGLVIPANGAVAGQTVDITAANILGRRATVTLTLDVPVETYAADSVSDPLVLQQWHLVNKGQSAYSDATGIAGEDIVVNPVYQAYGLNGRGVTVAVVDTGLEIAHEDLAVNVVTNGSWNFIDGTTDPTNLLPNGDHGTSVAGLIAAARNTVGGIGVASSVSLKGFNVLQEASSENMAAALGSSSANPNSMDVHIFNQSYGYSSNVPVPSDALLEEALVYGATSLRDGKGAIYVKSAGNGFNLIAGSGLNCANAAIAGISCENIHIDYENSLPFNIVVGALNANGAKSSYSTTGSAIWVSAPGGEFGWNSSIMGSAYPPSRYPYIYEPAMISTDQSGCAAGYATTNGGRSTFSRGQEAVNSACNYTNGMNGTSSAAPVTAGVISLMLEANPSLTWRDVKHILAQTSTRVDSNKLPIVIDLPDGQYQVEPGWTTNSAGYAFHNWYGFGRVNANAAVEAARNYPYASRGRFRDTGWLNRQAGGVDIPDNSIVGITDTIQVKNNINVEAVQIRLSLTHQRAGDLAVELTSPAGTRSVLKAAYDGMPSSIFINFRLLSNAFYGEDGKGVWTLKVLDGLELYTGVFNSWGLRIYGQ